jgi:hypothetical protein
MITTVMRSGISWKIHYDYWLSNRTGNNKKTGTVIVNSTFKPTRSAAEQYAREDVINFLGHSRGQYGYTGIKINFIGKVQPVLNSTKQKNGTPPAIEQIATQSSDSFE